ncbi:ATP-binding protein [Mesorhizobium sp. B2-3-6]|uniref:sensor histidine kinase n=1 Tax=Mesorhizobium sp. B2-3-6 TaxID=2589957 RepID=UPI001125E54C|nr:ATP-binding protein [Mesorhizobium sp. B2-3-6]TPM23142.1 ATP-binding protein [Mesorhizobium sp. B2-3-6]
MTAVERERLHFDVSTGLKSVLGSELITDDEVAIFELVKNSFDAEAALVELYFSESTITVADDGIGMSYDDIKTKWLFVAYSAKRESGRDADFRDDIAERRNYAGSKGIGRFSSDRLGHLVRLQTRPKSEPNGLVNCITVDWDRFDRDHTEHFEKIGINYAVQPEGFSLPSELTAPKHGTVITIERTRRHWDRDKILRLKSALAKLINPFGVSTDGFRIVVYAPSELEADEVEKLRAERATKQGKGDGVNPNAVVNGEVGNFIFSTLQEKTTYIDVAIDETGEYIESTLTDRGELIYRVREPNEFPLLAKSGFRCQIFFLNQSAKMTFARRMGVPSVKFGSVFLFRNGFRVYPIGEEGDDWFQMDRRKAQGYARFLGTRDVIGRIDVFGGDIDFQEASSRDAGLIETPTVVQLRKCFRDYCLTRLERYVVPVTFVDKEDKNTSDVSRLLTDPGRARVAAAVAKLVDDKNVQLLEYSRRLIGILSERSAQFEASLSSLRAIAEKTKDRSLFDNIEAAERRFEELREAEEQARRQADEERQAKEAAEARAYAAEKVATEASEKLAEERKRNLFLSSISTLDEDTIISLHHQITIYGGVVRQKIENFLVKISGRAAVPVPDVVDVMEAIAFLNSKILGVSKFATKANFRLESENIEADMGEYVEQYINGVARDFLSGPLTVEVTNDGKGFDQRFKPIDISVVVDNLIANARKAGATRMVFAISHPSKTTLHLQVTDNGQGFGREIDDLGRVFEKGFTTTDGSGLGLYHVRHVLGEMNGTIEAARIEGRRGASLLIRIAR